MTIVPNLLNSNASSVALRVEKAVDAPPIVRTLASEPQEQAHPEPVVAVEKQTDIIEEGQVRAAMKKRRTREADIIGQLIALVGEKRVRVAPARFKPRR